MTVRRFALPLLLAAFALALEDRGCRGPDAEAARRLHGAVQRQGPDRLEGARRQSARAAEDDARGAGRGAGARPTSRCARTGRSRTACSPTTARATACTRARTTATSSCYVDWKIGPGGDSGHLPARHPAGADLGPVQRPQPEERRGQGFGRPVEQPEEPARPAGEGRQPDRRVEHVPHPHGRRQGDDRPQRQAASSTTSRWRTTGRRDKPIYPREPIELQHHGNPLCFRNIYIKELPWVGKVTG